MRSSPAPVRLIAAFASLAMFALAPASASAAAAEPSLLERNAASISFMDASGVAKACDVTHLVAQEAAPPFGIGPCPGVRPGAQLWSDVGGCTFNFLFRGYVHDEWGNLVEAGRFMGTAGHCALENQTEQEFVWAAGSGPPVRDGTNARIGEFAYAVNSSTKDFALIRLDDGVNANPQMCHFGGPTGMWDPSFSPTAPKIVQHFGQGMVFGKTVSARSGAGYLSDPNWSFGGTAAIFGDSGSGVETEDGRAFGVLVAISPLGIVFTRMPPRVEDARRALNLVSLELQTAPEL